MQESIGKLIFFNELNNPRAGWRIAVFLLSFFPSLLLFTVLLTQLGSTSQLAFFTVLCGSVAFATFITLRLVDRRPFKAIGLSLQKRTVVEVAQGFGMGLTLVCLIFVVQYVLGIVKVTPRSLTLEDFLLIFATSLVFFAVSAFYEELLFRGYVFQTLIEGTNPVVATILMSALFAAAHLRNPGALISIQAALLATFNIILAGAWFSLAYLKTKSLWFPTALHLSWNFSEGFLFSFPVSGFTYGERSLFSLEQSGPSWVTGGPFGPEGGILVTAALVGSMIFMLKSPHIRVGEGAWNRQEFLLSSLLPKNGSRKKP